jgi:hypothetical protein
VSGRDHDAIRSPHGVSAAIAAGYVMIAGRGATTQAADGLSVKRAVRDGDGNAGL